MLFMSRIPVKWHTPCTFTGTLSVPRRMPVNASVYETSTGVWPGLLSFQYKSQCLRRADCLGWIESALDYPATRDLRVTARRVDGVFGLSTLCRGYEIIGKRRLIRRVVVVHSERPDGTFLTACANSLNLERAVWVPIEVTENHAGGRVSHKKGGTVAAEGVILTTQ